MQDAQQTRPRVFVLMPFDDSFSEIYARLIQAPFKQAGFDVYRADDIENQQSILKDIVTSIATADVIIADLTDSNPNVYYELGLAHALRKPVVLLTQDINSVPFDLRPYRVIAYDVHFARFEVALSSLKSLAEQIYGGTIVFGNPVSDFAPSSLPAARTFPEPSANNADEPIELPGFVDATVEFQEGLEQMTDLVKAYTVHVEEIGTLATEATPRLERASSQGDMKEARSILRKLASAYEGHALGLNGMNKQFKEKRAALSNSFEAILDHLQHSGHAGSPDAQKFLMHIRTMSQNSQRGKSGVIDLIEVMRALPKMEKNFDRASRRIVSELEDFTQSIDLIGAMSSRSEGVIATDTFDINSSLQRE